MAAKVYDTRAATALAQSEARTALLIQGLDQAIEDFEIRESRMRGIAQQTVNRGAAWLRTRIARAVRDEVRQSYGYALEKVFVRKAYFRGGLPEAKVWASKRGLLLSRFPYRKQTLRNRAGRVKPQGVAIDVGRNKSRKYMPGVFEVRLRGSGTIGLAMREQKGSRRFKVLHGPSASQIFDTLRPELSTEGAAWVEGELIRRIKVEIAAPGQQQYTSAREAASGLTEV